MRFLKKRRLKSKVIKLGDAWLRAEFLGFVHYLAGKYIPPEKRKQVLRRARREVAKMTFKRIGRKAENLAPVLHQILRPEIPALTEQQLRRWLVKGAKEPT